MSNLSTVLANAISNIEKNYGKGAVIKMDEQPQIPVESFSTGSFGLDLALGCNGLPRGRVIEIYGPEGAGKSTLAMQTVASAQAQGKFCAYIDVEHAYNPQYARDLGVQDKFLLMSQPSSGEDAFSIAETLLQTKEIAVLVIDSVAALTPQAEIDGDFGDSKLGLHARLMSQAMRKLTSLIDKSNTCVIFINQIREKIGVMFGTPETTTGGNALKFYASIRIDLRRSGQIKEGEEVLGAKVKAKIIKNKFAPPFRVVEFDLIYGRGIDQIGEYLDIAVEYGIIQKSGSWYSLSGSNLGQGREGVIDMLRDNPEVCDEIKTIILNKLKAETVITNE